MATLSRRFYVYSDGSIRHETPGSLPPGRYVRVLHEAEVKVARRNVPHGRPEVRQCYPENLFVPFGKSWQLFAWKRLNPLLKANNMTAVYDDSLWVSNNNGFGSSTKPRANYFENTHLSDPLPRVETITCGGNLLRVLGETTIFRGGEPIPSYVIETLDYRDPPPSPEWLEARPWLITHAVDLDSDGQPSRFPQGYKHLGFTPGVRHPFLSDKRKVVTIPEWRCVEWRGEFAPDAYKVYLPV